MPRGRKKAQETIPQVEIIKSGKILAETSAELAPPAANAEKAVDKTDKANPKSRAGRKPKSASAKGEKAAAAETADKPVKTAVSSDSSKTYKPKSNAGRKPKSADTKSEKSAAKAKKSVKDNKNVPVKSGRKPSTAKADTAAAKTAPAEKKKRAYNKKATTAKTEDVIIQSSGNEYSMSDITEMCRNAYRNGTRKQIKNIKVYIKPENNGIRAYYVVNDSANGFVDL